MKISRLKHIILTSVFFILIIIAILYSYDKKIKSIPMYDIKKEPRVVAVRDLPVGTTITQNDVVLKYLIPSEVHKHTVKDLNDVLGKKVTDRVMAEETILSTQLLPKEKWFKDKERIYAMKFDSETTGAFNVLDNEQVDIYVLYNEKNENQAQINPNKKTLDILLSKRRILDIRDDSGISIKTNPEVRPGYLVFSLTYDEIAKIENAKKAGKLYVGKYGSVTQKSYDEINIKPTPTSTPIPTPTPTPLPQPVTQQQTQPTNPTN